MIKERNHFTGLDEDNMMEMPYSSHTKEMKCAIKIFSILSHVATIMCVTKKKY